MFSLPHSLTRRLEPPREMMIAKMPSNYILWGLILIAILALLWLLSCNYWLPRFAAHYATATTFVLVTVVCAQLTISSFRGEN
jgi:hypothetical protein